MSDLSGPASTDPHPTIDEQKARLPDAGRRRHLSWGMDFDTRATTLGMEIQDDWEPEVKRLHTENKVNARAGIVREFGEHALDAKIENFLAIDTKPFSVLAHHNLLFHQVRQSFVIGSYYPALVGACALGERILNHLVIDLRDFYRATPEYRRVHSKSSFDDWRVPIDTLEAWGVLLPAAAAEFRALMPLRHRSIHFNVSTYATLRDDALEAVLHMRTIIEQQFGAFALRPWFIERTLGHVFIRKSYETHPFVRTYFLPRCPFVGPLFGMRHGASGWEFFDFADYGPGEWSDEEFAVRYNERDPAAVVTPPDDEPATQLPR